MKIINEKGKLFGFINIIDLLTIIVVLCVVVGILYKFKGDEITIGTDNTQEIEFVVRLIPNYEEFYQQLEVGDKIAEDKRYLNAEITDIKIDDYYKSDSNEDGEVVISKHPYFKEAIVTIKAQATVKGPIVKIGKQEIRAGSSFFVTTDLCKLPGFIYEIKE